MQFNVFVNKIVKIYFQNSQLFSVSEAKISKTDIKTPEDVGFSKTIFL